MGVSISHEQQGLVNGQADHPDGCASAEDRQQGASGQRLNQKQKKRTKKDRRGRETSAIQ
jgi:hypothetical protein